MADDNLLPDTVALGTCTDEVAVCQAAVVQDEQKPGEALIDWLRMQFDFIPNKRLIVSELLAESGDGRAVPSRRSQAIDAGRPPLEAAQEAGELRNDISLEQIFDMLVAIAKVHGTSSYLEPMLQVTLSGLTAPASTSNDTGADHEPRRDDRGGRSQPSSGMPCSSKAKTASRAARGSGSSATNCGISST